MALSLRAKRGLLWGLLALAALLLVKRFFADLRYVSSASMAPALQPGDLILVDRALGSSASLGRYDIVMFERPQLGSQFLKRIAGLPGETVQIVGGDLFVDGKIRPKTSEEFLRVAAPIFDSAEDPLDSQWEPLRVTVRDGGGLLLQAGRDSGAVAGLFRKIPYLIRENSPSGANSPEVYAHDAGMQLDFEAPTLGVLEIMFAEQGDQFRFRAAFEDLAFKMSVSRESVGPAERLMPPAQFPKVTTGSRHRLELGNADNRLFVRLDGKELFSPIPYERNTAYRMKESHEVQAPTNAVSLSFQGGDFGIARLRLLRDADYTDLGGIGVDAPVTLGANDYFLLGDNSPESEDSRSFGPVKHGEIRGKACWTIFPISRFCSH